MLDLGENVRWEDISQLGRGTDFGLISKSVRYWMDTVAKLVPSFVLDTGGAASLFAASTWAGMQAFWSRWHRCWLRRLPDELGQPLQILSECGEQDFIFDAAQAAQPEPVELMNALHAGEPHLYLFALAN
jgi:hypothetical protein